MPTYSIHINGIVQGVGFRPYVYRLAKAMHLCGRVSNNSDGVEILVQAEPVILDQLVKRLQEAPPPQAHITSVTITTVADKVFPDFRIDASQQGSASQCSIAPDMGLCADCKAELFDKTNRRSQYAFTHCTQCGPRYSVIRQLPFDRDATSMQSFTMCPACREEYTSPSDRRFHAQICSCPDCAIPLRLTDKRQRLITDNPETLYTTAATLLRAGKLLAVKSVGGYLLLCDARQHAAIMRLRAGKARGNKPFAVLYKDVAAARHDCLVARDTADLLSSAAAPIVILPLLEQGAQLAMSALHPMGDTVGIMLPSTPLLALLADSCNFPLVATSGNKAGESIAYTEDMAVHQLADIADYFIHFDRDIVAPEDDSVVRLGSDQARVMLRRSRGYAPSVVPPAIRLQEPAIAFGADLKAAFALSSGEALLISPYLGHLLSYSAQLAFRHTLRHLQQLSGWQEAQVLADLHPGYHSTQMAQLHAKAAGIPITYIPHHEAHAMAVLAEHGLLDTHQKILVASWDGTGYAPDGHIAGSEIYLYTDGQLEHIAALEHFSHLGGDRMATDTRLPLLSMGVQSDLIQPAFTAAEKQVYGQLLADPATLRSTSMGRLFDAVACLLGYCSYNTYEGEAALLLEQHAAAVQGTLSPDLLLPMSRNGMSLSAKDLLEALQQRMIRGSKSAQLALDFHYTLAAWLCHVAELHQAEGIALSGGVFQNLLLPEWIRQMASPLRPVYQHQVLAPNDECISYGQLAWKAMQEKRNNKTVRSELKTINY